MRRAGILGLTVLVATGAVQAQEVDCQMAFSQAELTFCAEQDWQAADADLNLAYAAARAGMRQIDAGLSEDQKGAESQLRDGQRAWVSFRDATCAAEGYAVYGGTAEPMVIYSCRARLTRQRSADLWAMAEPY